MEYKALKDEMKVLVYEKNELLVKITHMKEEIQTLRNSLMQEVKRNAILGSHLAEERRKKR
jgi:ribonuclease HIII